MATRRIKRTARAPKNAVRAARRTNEIESTINQRQISPETAWSTLILIVVGIILAFGLYLIFHVPQTENGNTVTTVQTENEVSYQGVEGKTALDLLKQKAVVETKTYEGLGELVTSINGKPSTSDHYWVFYVNGQQAEVGAGSYVTKSSDTIAWKYEKAQ